MSEPRWWCFAIANPESMWSQLVSSTWLPVTASLIACFDAIMSLLTDVALLLKSSTFEPEEVPKEPLHSSLKLCLPDTFKLRLPAKHHYAPSNAHDTKLFDTCAVVKHFSVIYKSLTSATVNMDSLQTVTADVTVPYNTAHSSLTIFLAVEGRTTRFVRCTSFCTWVRRRGIRGNTRGTTIVVSKLYATGRLPCYRFLVERHTIAPSQEAHTYPWPMVYLITET